jgi:ribose-phosphate pyrophosphokinase
MELLVLVDALRRASAWRINAVIPYFGYARQDKKVQAREPITAKLVANLLETAGVDRVITIDLHAGQIQGFFDVPVDHLTALDILANYLRETDLSETVVVSPDVGRATEARRLANLLNVPLAMLYKRRTSPTDTEVTHVIGEVAGKRPIMIDDMISTAGTMRRGIEALLQLGAQPNVSVAATHPVFTPPALERLTHPAIQRVLVTDTVPFNGDHPNVQVLSVASLLAKAIHNVHHNDSVSSLFTS